MHVSNSYLRLHAEGENRSPRPFVVVDCEQPDSLIIEFLQIPGLGLLVDHLRSPFLIRTPQHSVHREKVL